MCTAISVNKNGSYFGRNLDVFSSYGEKIVITPKNYVFEFSDRLVLNNHFAIIGMAVVRNNIPLYFDATNSEGLSMAGLNFPKECVYNEEKEEKINVASFELISRILSMCKTTSDAKKEIIKMNITKRAFDEILTPTPLHWIVSDKTHSLTVEQTKEGLKVYDNQFGVLTNSPEFLYHKLNVTNYRFLSNKNPKNTFFEDIKLEDYSNGMGTMGLPGDYSSPSRFVRVCFVKENSLFGGNEEEKVCQFFRILYSVQHNLGCVLTDEGYEYTSYSSCVNTEKGIYYYTTYNNSSINAVDMNRENLLSQKLIEYEIKREGNIYFHN